MSVLDINANHGLYTLLAARGLGANGGVFAFGPSPREHQRLRTHLWLNGCRDVRIVFCALSSRTSQADLDVAQGGQIVCNSLHPLRVDRDFYDGNFVAVPDERFQEMRAHFA